MRKIIKFKLIGLALIIAGMVACDTASQEVSPIVKPDLNSYPTVTGLTLENTGAIAEGDTIIYTIAISSPISRSLTFQPIVDETASTLVEHEDFDFLGVTINPWQTEAELWIITYQDIEIEPAGKIAFTLEVQSIAEKYLLHPDNVFPSIEVTVNPPRCLDIIMEWNSDDDIDFVVYKDETASLINVPYSALGATSSASEADNSINLSDVGTYYISILHWGAPSFDYTFTLGKPDATVQTITGTFTSDDLRAYYLDVWYGWAPDYYDSYRVLKVVNNGTSFTVTKFNALTNADYATTADLVGTWSGTDGALPDWGYATTTVEVTNVGGKPYIYGLNEGWMDDFWGETVQTGDPVEMIVYANGEVVIPHAYYWTTLYSGDLYDYNIYGVGTYDAVTGLHLEYEMDQDGFLAAAWTYANGYNDNHYFHADLTKGKNLVQSTNKVLPKSFVKPDANANRAKKEINKKK
jgi:hypothetical protein